MAEKLLLKAEGISKQFPGVQALEKVEHDFKPSQDRDYIIEFIRNSERGVIRAR